MKKELKKQRKKMILELMEDPRYVPMKAKELAALLDVKKGEREEFRDILDSLLEEGKITVSKRGKFKKAQKILLTGVFESNQGGFGFVVVEEREEDLFVPEGETHGAMHKDKVEVKLIDDDGGRGKRGHGKRQAASVVRILERGVTRVVGTYQKGGKGYGFLIPDNQRIVRDIFVSSENSMGAVNGQKAVAEIISYGDDKKKPEGRITEILGHADDPGVDILSIIKSYELPLDFPEDVLEEIQDIPDQVAPGDREGRLDLTGVQMVTIDGEDAKDLDDAVSLAKEKGRYKLGIHIADVSSYVREGGALDREALNRGTSVYLADRVIPMLPHKLSNGICSLNEREDRLALSCLMTIDGAGRVVDHRLAETVIRVDRRMSYTDVKAILEDGDPEVSREYRELVPMFKLMEELAAILRENRKERGSVDFDFPETKMILDRDGHPVDILPYDRNTATKMIEDFMLVANETVAEHFFWQETPFVYRTHDVPDEEKIMKLGTFIRNFGYFFKKTKSEIHPREFQKLLAKIEDTPEEAIISRLTLRSMKQARYTVENTGHFGLACSCYCHFTSPIRRYPDLQIHRIIKETLRGRMEAEREQHYEGILPGVAKRASEMERRADEAERETVKLKKAEYMAERVGRCYDGVISGVTAWGLYVELPNTVEGMVHVSKIPGDYFRYDEENYEMVGDATGIRYKLGQKVRIQVAGADRQNRTIDFVFPDGEDEENGEGERQADCKQQKGKI